MPDLSPNSTKRALEQEGIETKVFALDPQRPNLVARLRGDGKKRPVLVMGHTDVGMNQWISTYLCGLLP